VERVELVEDSIEAGLVCTLTDLGKSTVGRSVGVSIICDSEGIVLSTEGERSPRVREAPSLENVLGRAGGIRGLGLGRRNIHSVREGVGGKDFCSQGSGGV